MKKPMPRIEAYICYVGAIMCGILAIQAFQGREYIPALWLLFAIPAAVLVIYPTVRYIQDLYLWRNNPDEYKKKEDERQEKCSEYVRKNAAMRKAEEERKKKECEEKHLPLCPNCGAWDVERITTTSRAVSVLAVGVASGKIGKQYKCNKCKHMW